MKSFASFLLFLCAGCALAPPPGEDPESRPVRAAVPIAVTGCHDVSAEVLLAASARELASFQRHDLRAADLDDARDAMVRNLRAGGHAHAKASFRMEPSEAEVANVIFSIVEGPRTTLSGVRFEGNEAFSTERLARFFDFREAGGADAAVDEPVVYRRSEIDGAVSDVRGPYAEAGRYRVKVGPPRVEWDPTNTSALVVVPIEEGLLYTVRRADVEFDGESVAMLTAEAKRFVGGPYSAAVPARIAAVLRGSLADEGRLLMEVTPTVAIDDLSGSADVLIRVRRGPTIRVASVSVSGNERTDAGFIFEQSHLATGDVLTQRAIDRAIDELYGTGLFKSVRIAHTPRESEDDVRPSDVVIATEESPSRSVDFEAGYGSYELLRGAIRYRDRNLFGRGRMFEATPHASLKGYGAELAYFDDYVFGRENTFEVTTGYDFREEPSFDAEAVRLRVSVLRRFDRTSSLRAGYRLRSSQATNVEAAIPEDLAAGRALASGPFGEFEHDTRDDVFIPTEGSIATAGVALSSPLFGADLSYLETRAAVATFLPLGEGSVVGLRVRAVDRAILDDRATLPIQERLFLGGENSVRSFSEDDLGPTSSSGSPIGGLFALDASIEFRQRLFGDVYGAVFYDIGTVGRRSFDVGGPYGSAVGAGLRYLLPFGPIRLDFAFNPGRRFAADSDWTLHLSFGFSF